MKKLKVLFVCQEIMPFLEVSELAKTGRCLPQGAQESGREIRTFMPRFGLVNERRHQLHEVIRLSGMNLIIDGNDHPLIIKVASIQSARMQVYFIDNEEYFHRKMIFRDAKEKYFKDNEDRMLFYCRGVIETVKKLGWHPDVVHCQGWMTSLVPFLIKTAYKEEPLFADTKIVYSAFHHDMDESFSPDLAKKMKMIGMDSDDLKLYKDPTMVNIHLAAMKMSDAVIKASPDKHPVLDTYLKKSNKPVLEYQSPENEDALVEACNSFYDDLIEMEPAFAE